MKKVFNIFIWVIITSGIIFTLYFAGKRQSETKCTEFSITIDNNNSEPLISKEEIRSHLNEIIDTLEGKKITNIPIAKMESSLNSIPAVKSANIYSTLNGKLKVLILQKHPIIRIINSKNESIYIDNYESIIPTGNNMPARVLPANGNIHTSFNNINDSVLIKDKIIKGIYELAKFIHKNEFLVTQIEQIYVTKSGEFELLPKLGKHIIKFGKTDKMEKKFKKLTAFYKNSLNDDRLIKYKTLDLKYNNQVICSK